MNTLIRTIAEAIEQKIAKLDCRLAPELKVSLTRLGKIVIAVNSEVHNHEGEVSSEVHRENLDIVMPKYHEGYEIEKALAELFSPIKPKVENGFFVIVITRDELHHSLGRNLAVNS